jgi:DNA-binding response OmpR family regulator
LFSTKCVSPIVMKILLVEDDAAIAAMLTKALAAYQYQVDFVQNGQTAWDFLQTYRYDLLLLDVVVPQLDGITLCRKLRAKGQTIPILLLTARDKASDRVLGLEAGADDYVVKPFDLSELLARIRALLRRGSPITPSRLKWEALELDPDSGEVIYAGKPLHLTPKEYQLLALFLRHPQRIFSRSALLDQVWSIDEYPGEAAVSTQIKGLRQKLKAAGMTVDLIETLYGLGYRLRTPPDEPIPNQTGTVQPQVSPKKDRSEAEAKALAAIALVWQTFAQSLEERLAIFEQAIAQLITQSLAPDLQQQARAEAHRLVGSLGSFGVMTGSTIARQIEQLLQTELQPSDAQRFSQLLTDLKQAIAQKSPAPSLPSTHLLMIDRDATLAEQLQQTAIATGWQITIASDLPTANQQIVAQVPDAILLDINLDNSVEQGLAVLAELTQQHPRIPVLVLTAHSHLSDRLEAARLGSCRFLHKPIAPDQILAAARQVLQRHTPTEAKLLAVDDDPAILTTLTNLLTPWGFQVTTLAKPEQFWQVLETTAPDLLILDLEMPKFSGIELCQIVRNDAHWNHLPILILSAHQTSDVIQQVFATGADDYISKPIVEPELIARVLNRLERIKILQKLASQTGNQTPLE